MPAFLADQAPSVQLEHASKLEHTSRQAQPTTSRDLPSVAECAAHLQLLEAFVGVQESVHLLAPVAGLSPEHAWDNYRRRAVSHFEQWNNTPVAQRPRQPPLDVLMAWHAFMLHPKAYARFIELGGSLGLDGMDWSEVTSQEPTILNDDLGPQSSNLTFNDTSAVSSILPATNQQTGVFTLRSPTGTPLFTYDLSSAIARQSDFSSKMARHAWLRSPSCTVTLARSAARYANFFALIAANPGTVLVPTLDIDLAWHTHQLSPARYLAFSKRVAGRLIDHDDEIPSQTLATLSRDMGALWRAQFGDEYHVCLCWKCEGDRAAVDAGAVEAALRELAAEEHGLLPLTDLAFPQCSDCGSHPGSCCAPAEGDAGCGSGCGGGCGGGCGSGGCGSCGMK
ncbi:Glycine-rich domain-containing protein 1-like protein 1 [Colletotrichum chlorophyti]|uniref:Glycine-rich domain-containing protein 1-like protein 1 n=1 Tax=Colletotrichum chlorophyti TaxID=708187 RepID=A0A1Q8S4X4_9PEZI|nr:Glycine-rich domain-containing protein 1-like protein 1 [Colletotrichum chlorophyti]